MSVNKIPKGRVFVFVSECAGHLYQRVKTKGDTMYLKCYVLRVWLRNCRLITSFYCFTLLVLYIPVLFLWSSIFRSCIFSRPVFICRSPLSNAPHLCQWPKKTYGGNYGRAGRAKYSCGTSKQRFASARNQVLCWSAVVHYTKPFAPPRRHAIAIVCLPGGRLR